MRNDGYDPGEFSAIAAACVAVFLALVLGLVLFIGWGGERVWRAMNGGQW